MDQKGGSNRPVKRGRAAVRRVCATRLRLQSKVVVELQESSHSTRCEAHSARAELSTQLSCSLVGGVLGRILSTRSRKAETRPRIDTQEAIALAAGVNHLWEEETSQKRKDRFSGLAYSYYYAEDVPFSTQIKANYAWVMVFSFAGVACRYGTGKLSDHLGLAAPSPKGVSEDGALEAVLFYDLLANILGSLVMGACAGASPWIIPRFPAIYAGLTAGFCGCFTTFSSWNNAAASIMVRGDVARGLLCLAVGFATASTALRAGAQISSKCIALLSRPASPPGGRRTSKKAPPYPLYNTYKLPVGRCCLAVLLLTFGAVASVSLVHERRDASVYLGLCFAPLFASLRYYLSSLNRSHPTLPRYTLLANAIASVLTSLASALKNSESVDLSATTKSVLGALSLGAAGSLSTVSSFVNECRLLSPQDAGRYIVVTLTTGQLLSVSILAGFRALDGWDPPR